MLIKRHKDANRIACHVAVDICVNEFEILNKAAEMRGMPIERFLIEAAIVMAIDDVLLSVSTAITEDQQLAAEQVMS